MNIFRSDLDFFKMHTTEYYLETLRHDNFEQYKNATFDTRLWAILGFCPRQTEVQITL